jgi:hypothetical protein
MPNTEGDIFTDGGEDDCRRFLAAHDLAFVHTYVSVWIMPVSSYLSVRTPGPARTDDASIKSRVLCQLSYGGLVLTLERLD